MEITKIKTNKFKTNMCALFLTVPLTKENVYKNALIASILRRGTNNIKTQEEISKKLEEMYGAGFNCGVDKIKNYHVIKFYLEMLDNDYTLNKEDILQESINLLFDIAFNPLVEDGGFKEEYFNQEKMNLIKILNAKKDNKALYAKDRCIEEMFKNEPYGLYKYGSIEELESLDRKTLYDYYKRLINNCRIDLIISGDNIENIEVPDIKSKKIEEINVSHVVPEKPLVVKEKMDVTQGKLIIGLCAPKTNKAAVSMYNTILGGGANSKLFQNVREKASLAYSAGSSYIRRQNLILIQTGIEIENYEKALNIIKEQLEEMENGNITDEEFEAAKSLIVSSVEQISESHEDTITFYYDQRLFEENLTVEEYLNNIKEVTKEEVIKIAKEVKMDTIYFLTKND